MSIITEVRKEIPKAGHLRFEDIVDAAIVQKLDRSGFIDNLYK